MKNDDVIRLSAGLFVLCTFLVGSPAEAENLLSVCKADTAYLLNCMMSDYLQQKLVRSCSAWAATKPYRKGMLYAIVLDNIHHKYFR